MKRPLLISTGLAATLFVLGITLFSNAYAERPPKLALEKVAALATLNAAITICFQSQDYKKLGNESAINLHRLSSRIEDLVVKIQDQYSDSRLLTGYNLLVNERREAREFRIRLQEQIGSPCSSKLYTKVEEEVRNAEKTMDDIFLSKPK